MTRPTKMEFDCGNDIYGRTVRLLWQRNTCGAPCFSIIVDPANQRDDGYQILRCLTADNLAQMAHAAREVK